MPSAVPRPLLLAFALLSAHAVVTHAAITKIYPEGTTPCPEVPSLECKHDSQCVEGEAEMDPMHSHLNLKTSLHGYHCDCPDGFLGHDCDIRVEDCVGGADIDGDGSSDVHTCYHGSKCRGAAFASRSKQSLAQLLGDDDAFCDCDTLNLNESEEASNVSSKFAGLMCEHKATAYCAGTRHKARKKAFCANHGTCQKMVVDGAAHPGCRCQNGWAGHHCEIREEEQQHLKEAKKNRNQTANTTGTVLFSILIVGVGAAMGGMVVFAFRTRRQALEEEERKSNSASSGEKLDGDYAGEGAGAGEDTTVAAQEVEGGCTVPHII